MAATLFEDLSEAFRAGETKALSELLVFAVNRAADRMAEANRQRLTELWRDFAAVHYSTERLELTPDLREKRGYLEAIVHLSKAVRDLSDDLEAIEKVKKCVHGPKILAIIAKEGTIQHGELADRLSISAPSLTQAIRAVAESKTITATVHGKFKYYSLTPLGALVARKLGGEGALAGWIARMKRALNSRFPAGLPDLILSNAKGSMRMREQGWTSMYPSVAVRITPDPGSSPSHLIISEWVSPSGDSPDVTRAETDDVVPWLSTHELARQLLGDPGRSVLQGGHPSKKGFQL